VAENNPGSIGMNEHVLLGIRFNQSQKMMDTVVRSLLYCAGCLVQKILLVVCSTCMNLLHTLALFFCTHCHYCIHRSLISNICPDNNRIHIVYFVYRDRR
jgi:hypothetical protein